MKFSRNLWLGFLTVSVLSPGRLVLAQNIFSPGELAAGHKDLEGATRCTKCHETGDAISEAKCNACHSEIKKQIDAKSGFHGRMPSGQRSCEKCHADHLGRGHPLTIFEGGRNKFDHDKTGWPLKGKHAPVECDKCHRQEFIRDPDVLKLQREHPTRRTHLGLSSACQTCHFDEHRGQVKGACQNCHNEKDWSPAPGFNHNKTNYPLTGKHKGVKCQECHESVVDKQTPKSTFPAPVKTSFFQYTNIAYSSCLDCHADPHKGEFGSRCSSCHTTTSWRDINTQGTKDTRFHDKTDFPLKGAHADVDCKPCHGPFPGMKAQFKGIPHKNCFPCHADAHVGQLVVAGAKKPQLQPCEKCHSVDAWTPVRFDLFEHEATRYPLQGAHQATPCDACHSEVAALEQKIPTSVRKDLKMRKRPEAFSLALFHFDKPLQKCQTCHEDIHHGQFEDRVKKQGCPACHRLSGWRDLIFDHDRDSSYPLTGGHKKAACGRCHGPSPVKGAPGKTMIAYKQLSQECASCHPDVHVEQFVGPRETANPCQLCHTTENFNQTLFDHNDQAFSTFALEGKHAAVKCAGCHPRVRVGDNKEATRYKPVPTSCAGCHQDVHRGEYATLPDMKGGPTRCEVCHSADTWLVAHYDRHEITAMPLRGMHREVDCKNCHRLEFSEPMSALCGSCHRDVHQGDFGARCESCHNETNWQATFSADAHRRTGFPLVGRHAILSCRECHPGAQGMAFGQTTVGCYACHAADYQRTALGSINHSASGFGTTCRECHNAWAFSPANFPQHAACFQIAGGPHRGITCRSCHISLNGAQVTGRCATNTASCTACHEHACSKNDRIHEEVSGYSCNDRKCYECHKFVRD